MCKRRRPMNCIVPPHMLEAMLQSEDIRIRESALKTLTASARIRGEREIVGAIRSAMITNPIGKKHRSIYDGKHERLFPSQLPGTLVRDEGQGATSDPSVNQAYDALEQHTISTKKFWTAIPSMVTEPAWLLPSISEGISITLFGMASRWYSETATILFSETLRAR